jgi:GntR family histidine utilization transcriptional repressor
MSAKPRYQQLKDLIIDRIATGELRPNDRVPSEHELVDAMNVSRMTANRALRELHDEGYVERIAGRGTYVSDLRSQSHLVAVQNIADEISARGNLHACTVLRQSRQRARGEVAKALHVEQGAEVFHLLLVHTENGAPVQVEDRHILASFAPDCLEQDFTKTTPSAYLSSVAPLQEAEQVVRASMPNAAIRNSLAMDEGEPTLVIVRRTWSDGQAVTFGRFHHPGNRYELTGHYAPPGTQKSMPADVAQLETIEQ